jgi:hypothetical protein
MKDLDGLSVNIRSRTEVASWLATFSLSFGADTLHTRSIRDIDRELDVGQEEADEEVYPEHAIITGWPFSDDDPERAEILQVGSLSSQERSIVRFASGD